MKIIYLHQYFCITEGAGGTRSYEFAKSLVEKGIDVHMICISCKDTSTGLKSTFKRGKREGIVDGIFVTELQINYSNHKNFLLRSLIFLRYSLEATKLSIMGDYDIVFSTSTPLTVAIPAIILRWIKGTIFIFEVRDLWPELPKAMGVVKNSIILSILEALEKLSYYSADSIVGLAPGICDGIQKRLSSKVNVNLIPNACDLNLFYPEKISSLKENSYLFRYTQKINNNDFIALFSGAHGIANGLESILDVAKYLQSSGFFDIKILFIGDGSQKLYLKNLAKTLKLENCIFLEPVSKVELSFIMRECVDVGIMCLQNIPEFYNGTSPNKFFDYISAGLPVLINYPGWLAKIILDNNLGYFSDPNDTKCFAQNIITLYSDRKHLDELAVNCRSYAKLNFSREIMFRKLLKILQSNYMQLGNRRKSYFSRIVYIGFKRICDLSLATILLILMLPFYLIIALLVYCNMGNPVFFTQSRPGYKGNIFQIYKFTSMKNLYNKEGKLLPDKYRLTKFGKFLRSYSLDELPEIINIIKGEMSFVGPRPLLERYLNYYTNEEKRRHDIKPGITGMAQVNGRNSINWDKKFKYDIYYVDNISFLLDIKILIKTILKVFIREGINAKGESTMSEFKR